VAQFEMMIVGQPRSAGLFFIELMGRALLDFCDCSGVVW
jgi:hypothetical protein